MPRAADANIGVEIVTEATMKGCNAVKTGRISLTFRKKVLAPSSGLKDSLNIL